MVREPKEYWIPEEDHLKRLDRKMGRDIALKAGDN